MYSFLPLISEGFIAFVWSPSCGPCAPQCLKEKQPVDPPQVLCSSCSPHSHVPKLSVLTPHRPNSQTVLCTRGNAAGKL